MNNPDLLYEVRDVCRDFSATIRAVDHISLRLHAKDRLGIVGESGSGKSTLIKMMAALDQPSCGTINFCGTNIVGLSERKLGFLRSDVQIVFQDPRSSLNPRMNVYDIITEPLRSPLLKRRDDIPADPRQRFAQLLDAVGLPHDAARRYPHEFSGGQRQRIAMARALAPGPRVLIADEPVSALDVSVRAQILNLLTDLIHEFGLTLIFISHDLDVVKHVCDHVMVLRQGRVVESGPLTKVYANPRESYTQELLAAIPRLRLA